MATTDQSAAGSPTPEEDAYQYQARLRADAKLAERLGLTRPYVSGPSVGHCPGGGEYGHGMSLTTTHTGCCARWDTERTAAIAAGEYEPTELDRLLVDDPPAGRLRQAQERLAEAERNHVSGASLDRLQRSVASARADMERCQTCNRDAHRPETGWQGHYYRPSPSVAASQAEPDAGR